MIMGVHIERERMCKIYVLSLCQNDGLGTIAFSFKIRHVFVVKEQELVAGACRSGEGRVCRKAP
jgi:hypothetical protein